MAIGFGWKSLLSATFLLLGGGIPMSQGQSHSGPAVIPVEGDVDGVHDPSIAKEGDTWYLFGTVTEKDSPGQLPIRCSKDLHRWERCGFIFQSIPDWIKKESPETKDLWAPDVSYFGGKYHVYYAFSVFGKNTSGIALVTNKTLNANSPDFKWVDESLIFRSNAEDNFNAIDPNIVADARGGLWMSFGSFWSGIKMHRIDPQTGKIAKEDPRLYAIAQRVRPENPGPRPPNLPDNWQAIEAPFIVHHGDYFYLFVSFDLCCRGAKSNYKTMVGRSHNVTGPYADMKGKPMMEGGGTPLLLGNAVWAGPGGESVLQQADGDIIVFHAYNAKTGKPRLHVSTIDWTDGWPHAAMDGDAATSQK